MIEQHEIDGRQAHVVYLDDALNPVDRKDEATLIKLIFADGETAWLTPKRGDAAEDAAFDRAVEAFIRNERRPDEGVA